VSKPNRRRERSKITGSNCVPGQNAKHGETVIYHFHNESGLTFNSDPSDTRVSCMLASAAPSDLGMKRYCDGFLKYFPQDPRMYGVEYRLSTVEPFGKSSPFPAWVNRCSCLWRRDPGRKFHHASDCASLLQTSVQEDRDPMSDSSFDCAY